MLERIGRLATGDEPLMKLVAEEGINLNDFAGQAEVPAEFRALLAKHGYEPMESRGMLFAHNAGVGIHTDEELTACWFLHGLMGNYCASASHELIVAGDCLKVRDFDVVIFDSTLPHGVIAQNTELWACFSVYIKKIEQ